MKKLYTFTALILASVGLAGAFGPLLPGLMGAGQAGKMDAAAQHHFFAVLKGEAEKHAGRFVMSCQHAGEKEPEWTYTIPQEPVASREGLSHEDSSIKSCRGMVNIAVTDPGGESHNLAENVQSCFTQHGYYLNLRMFEIRFDFSGFFYGGEEASVDHGCYYNLKLWENLNHARHVETITTTYQGTPRPAPVKPGSGGKPPVKPKPKPRPGSMSTKPKPKPSN